MKNDVFHRENKEQRISSYIGRVLAVTAPRYVVLHLRAKTRRSSSSRRGTLFFILAPRYVVLHPCAEIRSSSAQFKNPGIPLADSNLKLTVALKFFKDCRILKLSSLIGLNFLSLVYQISTYLSLICPNHISTYVRVRLRSTAVRCTR